MSRIEELLQYLINRVEWKIAIKTALAGSLGLCAGLLFSYSFERPDTIISGMWTAMAAIVVQQTHLGTTYRTAWIRFLGVFIGCLMGAIFTSFMGSNPVSLFFSIFMTFALCSMVKIRESIRIACLSVAVVMILWGLRSGTSPWAFGLYRFLDSCLGIGVAVAIAHLVWPSKITLTIGKQVSKTLYNVAELYRMAASVNPLNDPQLYVFKSLANETDEMLWKNRKFLEDSKLELLSRYGGLDEWALMFWHYDLIFDKIISLSRVRKDHLGEMIDEGINKQLQKVMGQTDAVFSEYADCLINFRTIPDLTPLQEALNLLNDELVRFRHARGTRPYDLEDVEGFFVYFYTLRAIAEELQKTYKHIQRIKDS